MLRVSVRLALIVAVVSTIGCDRMTKHLATTALAGGAVYSYLGDTVRLEYEENSGGFLGMGADWPDRYRMTLFTIGTGFILLAVLAVAVRCHSSGWRMIGACLVLAGGASNWIDRVVRGSVVDFMNVGVGPIRTGVFNVADVAIMAGVAVLLLTGFHPSDGSAPRRSGHAT